MTSNVTDNIKKTSNAAHRAALRSLTNDDTMAIVLALYVRIEQIEHGNALTTLPEFLQYWAPRLANAKAALLKIQAIRDAAQVTAP